MDFVQKIRVFFDVIGNGSGKYGKMSDHFIIPFHENSRLGKNLPGKFFFFFIPRNFGIFIFGLVSGQVGPPEWNWIRITILGAASFAFFFVATVPEHFLEEHLWKHLARQHLPRIFLWTFGTLLVMHLLTDSLHLEGMIQESPRLMLMFAGLIGLIPESGPHLIFVTLYAQGTVPFSILLASSIVQDGHGMLPLLAHSRKAFVVIKLVNLLVGWAVGAVVMGMGL